MSSSRNFFGLALILGLVSAIGPFAIDMYLPALPSIGASLNASPGAVQMSLMAFFIASGVCQLIYGPISDMIGRKPPLYFGLSLFIVGSIGCALAPTIHALIAFRVVQAVGACAGSVVPRAMVRDMYTGPEAARLMSLLMLVFSISPILAPSVGGAVIALTGWRGVFWATAIAAVIGLILIAFFMKETRPAEARSESSWTSAVISYGRLLKDRHYLAVVLVGAFGVSSFFVYVANSSFVIIDFYGLSPSAFAIFFAFNAAAFFAAAQFTGMLSRRLGLGRLVRLAVTGFAASMVLMTALFALGLGSLAVMSGMLFIGWGFLGLVMPTTGVLAMEAHGRIAGSASALMGAIHVTIGAATMAIAGLFADGKPLSMITGITACALTAFVLAQIFVRPPAADVR
ncbi:multidrug effflux MFS transporter [Caulobacter sp. NIBR2454]|uniref:multidrug effflux MFS transporter n=1 Tax=Caulobacter sp. NIBR2454 TaxID=3015996 RepID=UPI0022B69BFB|nr:multidrug effflux MFS transporter [Caulobacter sp. NIBR2454]